MSRYRLELATPADDADLRAILAQTPMPGPVSVAFLREPSFFEAAVVDGRARHIVTGRDLDTGRLVGFGSRSFGLDRFVNGEPQPVAYLSALRLLPAHRQTSLVARGYAFFRQLHADGAAQLYLTTIAEGNPALALLTSGRAGLPKYHDAGRYHTLVLPPRRRAAQHDLEIRVAAVEDWPAVVDFLLAHGPRRQFFPRYEAGDFGTATGLLRALLPGDLLLAFRGDRLVGTLGSWDQSACRQIVVSGYGGLMRYGRPWYNLWARCLGRPALPEVGERFRYRFAALAVVAEDSPEVFHGLLTAQQARLRDEHLLVGLHERDPLLASARRGSVGCYTTRLFLVCWDDGETLRQTIDSRPPYLELGSL